MLLNPNWSAALDGLNAKVLQLFGEDGVYSAKSGVPAPFAVVCNALDPLRQEEIAPGNFTLRWVREEDMSAAGCVPTKGDILTIDTIAYRVEQVQSDSGRGIKLVLLRAA